MSSCNKNVLRFVSELIELLTLKPPNFRGLIRARGSSLKDCFRFSMKNLATWSGDFFQVEWK